MRAKVYLIIAREENSSSANSLHQIPTNDYDGLIDQDLKRTYPDSILF